MQNFYKFSYPNFQFLFQFIFLSIKSILLFWRHNPSPGLSSLDSHEFFRFPKPLEHLEPWIKFETISLFCLNWKGYQTQRRGGLRGNEGDSPHRKIWVAARSNHALQFESEKEGFSSVNGPNFLNLIIFLMIFVTIFCNNFIYTSMNCTHKEIYRLANLSPKFKRLSLNETLEFPFWGLNIL